jgi:large subunit ribosomal protein L4e
MQDDTGTKAPLKKRKAKVARKAVPRPAAAAPKATPSPAAPRPKPAQAKAKAKAVTGKPKLKAKPKTGEPKLKTKPKTKGKGKGKTKGRVKLTGKEKALPKEKVPIKIPERYEPGRQKVNLYSTKGTVVKEIPLPRVFDSEYRPDLIRKAVKVSQANRRQRYGPAPMAGMRHAVSQWGKGRGSARVQRLTQGSDAAESPPNVGGRRAHPPTPEHDWSLKMNSKERRKARYAALASTAMPEVVRDRGHKFGKKVTVPIVVEDNFATLVRTKAVIRVLERLKVYDDVERATDGRHVRVGRGKMRGRRYRKPNSVLIVVPEFVGIQRGANNLPGVEIVTTNNLNTELLAPGGDPGRLIIMTESSVKLLGEWN